MTNVKQYTLNHLNRAAAMLSPFFIATATIQFLELIRRQTIRQYFLDLQRNTALSALVCSTSILVMAGTRSHFVGQLQTFFVDQKCKNKHFS